MTVTVNNSPLGKERSKSKLAVIILFLATTSGFSTHLLPIDVVSRQWIYLLHVLIGIAVVIGLLLYVPMHFRRTLGMRKAALAVTGYLLAILFLALSVSGLHTILFGQSEALRWIHDLHVWLAYLIALFFCLHLLFFALNNKSLPPRTQPRAPIITDNGTLLGILVAHTILVPLVYGVSMIYRSNSPPVYSEAAVQPYELPYGQHPFRPSQTETPKGEFVKINTIARSNRCGVCHEQIFEQWQASMHAQAASDPAYVTNINLLAESRGLAATRYCEGCHAPVALLTGQLTRGGQHGGEPDTAANVEGVSCLGCHNISRAVHLRGVASYEFSPSQSYLFAYSDSLIATKLHNFLIRLQPAAHRLDMRAAVVSSPELCATCHVQFMDKDMNGWGWVKMQDEYTSWLNSRFSGQSQHTFSEQRPVACNDCHMPLMPMADPSANKRGLARSHRTIGANTAIPWLNGDTEQLQATKNFLRTNKVQVSIDVPSQLDATRSEQFTSEASRLGNESPPFVYLGEALAFKVTVSNAQVGHAFPGGTIDINQAWLWIRIVDAAGRAIFESGDLDSNNVVDTDAHFYRSVPFDRHGNEVWKHDLFNVIGHKYKKTIPPGEADVVDYWVVVPYWAKGPLSLSAVLRYRKFNARYARWALGDQYVDLPIVDMARSSLKLPVQLQPEVARN